MNLMTFSPALRAVLDKANACNKKAYVEQLIADICCTIELFRDLEDFFGDLNSNTSFSKETTSRQDSHIRFYSERIMELVERCRCEGFKEHQTYIKNRIEEFKDASSKMENNKGNQ